MLLDSQPSTLMRQKTEGIFRLSWSLIGKFGEAFELQDFPFDSQDFTVSMNLRYPNKGLKMVLVTSDNSRIMPKALSLVQHAWRNPKMHLWEEVVPNRNATAVSRHVLNATLSMNRVPNYYFSKRYTANLHNHDSKCFFIFYSPI